MRGLRYGGGVFMVVGTVGWGDVVSHIALAGIIR